MLLIFSSHTAQAENPLEVQKNDNPEFQETIYSVAGDSCGIQWTVRHFSVSSGFGISEHSKCALSLSNQIPYRSSLLRKVIVDTNNMQGMRNYSWGRLQRSDANDEYALRLARAAMNSKQWNSQKGVVQNHSKGINHYIAELLNQNMIFAEVSESFASSDYELKVNDVEKVLIGNSPVGKGQLPFDCIVSFSVLKKKAAVR